MKVLVFHGYLLRGTGSNVYNASVATALARMGHEVHLLCQDRRAAELPWVNRVGSWAGGTLQIDSSTGGGGAGAGTVTAYVPDIGDLLPVYVADEYEGFRVKTFPQLSEDELGAYLDANVSAVRDVVVALGGVDAALANHLVMGPAILARAGLRFAVKIHGSALEYTVKPHPERFLPIAREGIAAAAGVLVGSGHSAASLWRALDDPALPGKTRLGPPGVDTELFAPIPRARAEGRLRQLAADLRAAPAEYSSWERDPEAAAGAVERVADASGPRAVFVGKLIVSKGIDLLLAAWPLVHSEHPGAHLLVVGFGEYEEASMRLWSAIERGDLAQVREIAARGRVLEGGPEAPLEMLTAFLSALPSDYAESARAAAGTVAFAGRLEHDEVGRLVPATDALVVPSTFPESFGMVAAEAAAAGVPPVCARHSGLAEVSGALAGRLPPEVASLVSFELDRSAVRSLADRIQGWLDLDAETRERARTALRDAARGRWSWEGVARTVLAASAGRLDDLPEPQVPPVTRSSSSV
ncbi:MAG TPA: glycosyltransferase family 4 protein [Solirubrobacterales bacterium]|nr:glycosyltransferase family 4 protein [Solirubrobacterales bacterium]